MLDVGKRLLKCRGVYTAAYNMYPRTTTAFYIHTIAESILCMDKELFRASCTNMRTCDNILLSSVSVSSFMGFKCSHSISMPIIYQIRHESLIVCQKSRVLYTWDFLSTPSAPPVTSFRRAFVGAVNWLYNCLNLSQREPFLRPSAAFSCYDKRFPSHDIIHKKSYKASL